MRRFSQRNSLVTLNEINITPLLDLAFVLLIIFIIVSGSIKMEHGIDVTLPEGGKAREELDPRNIRTITVTRQGEFRLSSRLMPLDAIERQIVAEYRANPKLMIDLRIDELATGRNIVAALDMLVRNNIQRVVWPTRPRTTP